MAAAEGFSMDCIAVAERPVAALGAPVPVPVRASGTSTAAVSLCLNCEVRTRCLGGIAAQTGTVQVQGILAGRRTLRVREVLYQPDDGFEYVYAVRSGALASVGEDGESVQGLHFPGELVGVDGMASGRQQLTVRAMEDTQVCAMRFAPRESDGAGLRALLARLWDMMSCELVRERAHQALLASLPPQRRVAAFLASAAARMRGRGALRMPGLAGGEIASYLRVAPEAVAAVLESGLPLTQRQSS